MENFDLTKLNTSNSTLLNRGVTSNKKCADTIDILFDKIVELMNKDTSMNAFEKGLFVRGTKSIAPKIKDYIIKKMTQEDAEDIRTKIKIILQ